jgi:hypothetical protein
MIEYVLTRILKDFDDDVNQDLKIVLTLLFGVVDRDITGACALVCVGCYHNGIVSRAETQDNRIGHNVQPLT